MAREHPDISLEQYAGIQAAVADGHELEAVLAQEGVPAWCWPDIELEHTDAITQDPEMFEAYAAKLEVAEDTLRRRIAPLDDDLASWTAFTAALVADASLLDRHELLPTDIKRLQRAWQARFEADEELERRARELSEAPPDPPESIDAEPRELRPFPWSPDAEAAKQGASLEPLDFLARTTVAKKQPPRSAELPFGGQRPAPPARLSLEPHAAFGQTAPVRSKRKEAATPFEPQPPPSSDPPAETPAPVVAPAPPPTRTDDVQPPSPLEPVATLGSTAGVVKLPDRPAVPFQGQRPAPTPVAGKLEPNPELGLTAPVRKKLEPHEELGQTAPVRKKLEPHAELGQTAPMRKKVEPKAQLGQTRSKGLEPLVELGQTAPLKKRRSGPAVPFTPDAAGQPPPKISSLEPHPELGMTAGPGSRGRQPTTPEQYAAMCAELDAPGADRAAVLQRWAISSEEQFRAVESTWRERFVADTSLRDRFAAALGRKKSGRA